MREGLITKNDLKELSLFHFSSEEKLFSSINELIEIFNFDRENLSDSYLTKELVTAYLYYFFATNVPKIPEALKMLGEDLLQDLGGCDVVDFGSGPGTLIVGWEYFFRKKTNYFLFEKSKLMRDACKKVIDHWELNPRAKLCQTYSSDLSNRDTALCFSNSYNEIEDEFFFKVVRSIDPRFLIFLEPGTKEVFSRLQKTRVKLIEMGFQVHYPCASQEACPIDASNDWCHQYLSLSHDPDIERITQKLKRDRRNVPVIFHVYEKRRNISRKESAIIFRKPTERKFGYEFPLCISNPSNEIVQVKVLKKREGYVKKRLKSLRQGQRIEYKVLKLLKDSSLEIELL